MEILFEHGLAERPKVSFVLLDWSCRESFHMFHYLNQQNVPRDNYEIIWIEYYNRRSPEIRKWLEDCARQSKPPMLDQWIVMDMPETLYYHKHLMYNIGIVLSRGEVVTICDSDAMVRPTFVETIIKSFEEDPNIALHMDEVRNNDQRFHPFNYPSFDEVEGEGAINLKNGTTTGLLDTKDPLHTLNYGACLCARRDDLISIGGSDEHLDYLGHVCGPYELTFRLKNLGRREFWHPGQAGSGNYVGPHDGMHMSSTALEAVKSGRIQPLLENKAIRALREDPTLNPKTLIPQLIDPSCFEKWTYEAMSESSSFYVWETAELVESLFHYNIIRHMGRFYGLPQALGAVDLNKREEREHPDILVAGSHEEIKNLIEKKFNRYGGHRPSVEPQARGSLRSRVFNQIRRFRDILKPDFASDGPAPVLLDSHRGYNLAEYGEKLYGIPFTLGEVDLSAQDTNALPEEIVAAFSQDTVKSLIDQLKNMPEGQVIEEYQSFNIVKWGALLYGVPQFFGPVDQSIAESQEGSLFPKASTLEHLKSLIDQFNQSPGPGGGMVRITAEDLNHPSVLSGASLEILKDLIEDQTEITSVPKLLEGRKGFNIVKFKRQYWAIPQSLGEIDLMEDENLENPSILSAGSREDVKKQIDEKMGIMAAPQLVEVWANHNIIKFQNKFWGIPQSLGELDLTNLGNFQHPSVLSAASLEGVKKQIDAVVGIHTEPKLFEEWNDHNIIKFQNKFWGIPQSLGELDLTDLENLQHPSILSVASLEDVKHKIDVAMNEAAPPEFLEEMNGYNLVKYQNWFYGIPQALMEVCLTRE